MSNLKFNKKMRGSKDATGDGMLPDKITKRDCVSKVTEIFNPLGRLIP